MPRFFTKLREVIGDIENLAFVTDRGQSIINGIAEVFPEAHHGYCMYHIQGNLKTRYRGSGIVALFRRAAEAYSFEEFTKFMGEIEHKSESAWEYLSEMGVEHWARSHFSGRRYNMMMSNNAESLNALFKKDRELPILVMIENICNKLQQWFHNRRAASQNCTSVLTPAQENKCFKAADVARKLNVEAFDEFRFSVQCALGEFFMLACSRSGHVSRLCSENISYLYYTAKSWRAAYAETIFPLPNESEWEVLTILSCSIVCCHQQLNCVVLDVKYI
ncbi:uncharacterized protein LOC111370206 [Olea europaea var. sylvestris]|uniref:uncharacterized protein LOC111370206 n=1 Tax=Olea europaea var. sylvestris TaxID=158386 RepID=UPI000C1CF161|nr:uncharacterized protein LOC111370206 [Olea europaea var. sylvestris]